MASEGTEPNDVKGEAPPAPTESKAKDGGDQLPGESMAPSKLDMTGMEDEDKSKMAQLGEFIYNPTTKRVLGRGGISWLQIFIFYIMYYFFVFTFFFLWLIILIQTSGDLKPGITGLSKAEPVILGTATGLSVFPTAPITSKAKDFERIQSYTIYYNLNIANSWEIYSKRLGKTVSEINQYNVGNAGGCTAANNFGYKDGKPCVLIRFNHIFDWQPKPMDQLESYLKKNYDNADPSRRYFNVYMEAMKKHAPYNNSQTARTDFMASHVGIHCLPDGPEETTMGSVTYYPAPGIPVAAFKEGIKKQGDNLKDKKGRWNWTPYIFVQFNDPTRDVFIPVICRAFEENMDLYYSREGVGSVRFSLYILTKKI